MNRKAKPLSREQFAEMVGRAHADVLARLPYDYPEIHERAIKMMKAQKRNTTKVTKQSIQRISMELLAAALIVAPWFV